MSISEPTFPVYIRVTPDVREWLDLNTGRYGRYGKPSQQDFLLGAVKKEISRIEEEKKAKEGERDALS